MFLVLFDIFVYRKQSTILLSADKQYTKRDCSGLYFLTNQKGLNKERRNLLLITYIHITFRRH